MWKKKSNNKLNCGIVIVHNNDEQYIIEKRDIKRVETHI